MARRSLIFFFALFFFSCGSDDVKPEKRNFGGCVFIQVPEGDYVVGETNYPRNPKRTVHLKSYFISEHEVTNAEFAEFVKATGYITDAEKLHNGKNFHEGLAEWQWIDDTSCNWKHPFGTGDSITLRMNHPVTQISRNDAEAYCRWAGARLPAMAEWEVAARAGASTKFPWGDEMHPGGKAMANTWEGKTHFKNLLTDNHMLTAPVKSYAPNNWGLYDVIGNVFEYCSDELPNVDPGNEKLFTTGRGGSWWCSENSCDAFNCYKVGRMIRNGSICNQGFRLVRDVVE